MFQRVNSKAVEINVYMSMFAYYFSTCQERLRKITQNLNHNIGARVLSTNPRLQNARQECYRLLHNVRCKQEIVSILNNLKTAS
jgi:hypothetical protein